MRKSLSWSLSLSLSLSLGLLVVGCAREQEAVEVTWPDGSPRTAYVVLEGDTVGFRAWHENGQLDREGGLKDGQRDGKWQAFYDDGTPWAEHEYAAGVQIGAYRTWYPNGTPNIEGQYDATGKPTGEWQFYDPQGRVAQRMPADSLPDGF
jgi:antitoxin component YwqK of YwqJK toxin-antitoxin module